MASDVGEAEVEAGDAAFLALINAHRATSGYSALPDMDAVRLAYMGSKTDGMGERWLEHERRKSDAVLAAARSASSPQDGGEALREARAEVERLQSERDEARASNRKLHRDIQQREREFVRSTRADQRRVWLYLGHPGLVSSHTWARREIAKQIEEAEDRAAAAERERDEARAVIAPFARYAELHSMLDAAEGEIGEFYPGALRVSINYRDLRAARDLARKLAAAALDPPPRGATGTSGTRDGQGEVGDVD